jgi:hypothetical protein
LALLAVLPGCAGTRLPKLAKCTGPYRTANPYGSVLPTLPVSGGLVTSPPEDAAREPASAGNAAPSATPATTRAPPAPIQPLAGAGRPQRPKTSSLAPYYPSC